MSILYVNWEWLLSPFMLLIAMLLNASSDYIAFKKKRPIQHSLNVAYVSVPAIMCAWDLSEIASLSVISVLILIAVFRWFFHDLYFNLRVGNKWWYVGDTSIIDRLIRYATYHVNVPEGVKWQALKTILSLIFITISILIK